MYSNHYARIPDLLRLRPVLPVYFSQSIPPSSHRSIRDCDRLFLLNCNAVFSGLKRHNMKVSVTGRGPLRIYWWQCDVLLLGAPQNIADKPAFLDVEGPLKLLVVCVRAGYGLKSAYERVSYQYEQFLVLGARPQNKAPVKHAENCLYSLQNGSGRRKKRAVKRSSVSTSDQGASGASAQS